MADAQRAWPENAPGRFFVDQECIDCDLCRCSAPSNFARSEEGYSFVARQPETLLEEEACALARSECPVEAIGAGAHLQGSDAAG